MKSLIIILSFFIVHFSFAQDPGSSCTNPIPYCFEVDTETLFGPDQGFQCVNGYTKIYLNFKYNWQNTSPFSNQGFGYVLFDPANLSVTFPSTYTLYGPFDDNNQACDLISSYQAPIALQGASVPNGGVSSTMVLEFGKFYFIEITVNECEGNISFAGDPNNQTLLCPGFEPIPCVNCIPKFQPDFGEYVISAWVKETTLSNDPVNKLSYDQPVIDVLAGGPVQSFEASGKVIDGWQKVEGVFVVTDNTTFELQLKSTGANKALFDDIRIHPNDGSAITYVYDPLTLRLMAELDERNYATLYEYDEEGKLVRIKKETEKGIMTIQENRENNALKP